MVHVFKNKTFGNLIGVVSLAVLSTACSTSHHNANQIKSRYGAPVSVSGLRPPCNIQLQPCGYISQLYRVDYMANVTSQTCCDLPQTMMPPPPPVAIAPEPAPLPPVTITPEPAPLPPPVIVQEPEPPIYVPPPQHWPEPEVPYEPWTPLRK